jgi:HD-GYP domain-containing protein (c-di-GMP phosphodiesterase class II)
MQVHVLSDSIVKLSHIRGMLGDSCEVTAEHECPDGSGYPDGLRGKSISDLTRIVTISDIFAALIERRSYKPTMSREKAFGILRSMDGKLEMPLVSAFAKVALSR